MKAKEYNTIEEMNKAHDVILNGIDNRIKDSYFTYSEYADKMGYSLKDVTMDEVEPYEYSTYIPQANITAHELSFDGRHQFRIGNNMPSAE